VTYLYRWIKRLFGFREPPQEIKRERNIIKTVYPLRGLAEMEERVKAARKT